MNRIIAYTSWAGVGLSGSPGKMFARFGAAEWDERRTAFREPLKAAAE
jgi:hypothetical protein